MKKKFLEEQEQLLPKKETKEIITEEQVIKMLEEDPKGEGREIYNKWLDEQQQKADEDPTSKGRLKLNIKIAEIYRQVYLDTNSEYFRKLAYQAYLDAANQAHQEGNDELYNKLIKEANELRKKAKKIK